MATATTELVINEDCQLYSFFGVQMPKEPNRSGQFICDCPFCEKEKHFFISAKTGQFHCKVCHAKGNKYTFLNDYYDLCKRNTKDNTFVRLSLKRKKFPPAAYQEAGIVYAQHFNSWLIPVLNQKKAFVNLLAYDGNGQVLNSPTCKTHLGGLNELKPTGPVFICEGWGDYCALRYTLVRCSSFPHDWSVLFAPGCSLPKDDLAPLTNREVYLLFDNDKAGAEGMTRGAEMLSTVAKKIFILAWPVDRKFANGYDLHDYIRESKAHHDQKITDLLSWCFRYEKGADPSKPRPRLKRDTIEQVIKDFQKTKVHLYPGLIDALKITCGCVFTNGLDGEPFWMYLIGSSSCGKSLILESTLGSEECIYRTSINYRTFMSGYKDDEDRSLLIVLPGKTFVVKDYSNILSLAHAEREQLTALLRDVFDGQVSRTYGNGKHVQYPLPGQKHCRFNFVAGVTKLIHRCNSSGLGERFLKFEIESTPADDERAIRASLSVDWKDHEDQVFRQASLEAFFSKPRNLAKPPTLPKWYMERIIALTQFVCLCRPPVSRTAGNLDYEPAAESGPRVAQQLQKLSQGLCWALNKPAADKEVYRLIRKVAWDTSHGWRRNLYYALWELDDLGVTELSEAVNYSLGTTHRGLMDMMALGIVRRGQKIYREETRHYRHSYRLTPRALAIFKTAKIEEI